MWISNINKRILPLIFFAFSFLQVSNSHASKVKDLSGFNLDTSKTELRQADPKEQKKILEDDDYRYDRVGPAPKTAWDRFWEWFWRKVAEIFDSEGGSIGLRIIEYALILGAIALMVYLLLKNDIRALFYGKSASVPIDFSEFSEDIHSIDFDVLIAAAISKKDYRRAVRLHFLKLLKELTDKGLITWQIDKTNNDYSVELANSKYSGSFKELSQLYEYVWYGDFVPDEKHFSNTVSKFNSFRI